MAPDRTNPPRKPPSPTSSPADQRCTGDGVFTTSYGIAWLAGSTLIGALSQTSLTALVTFTLILQTCVLAVFIPLTRHRELRRATAPLDRSHRS